jgi:exoribonuclease-2
MGAQGLPRAAKVRVKLGEIDLITLDVNGTVIERLDTPVPDAHAEVPGEDDEDEDEVAGPIAIAVDINEPEPASNDNPS